jgi:hypothetical protein
MIKLKDLLLKEDIARKRYSWQYPSGVFKPIKYSHGSDAFELTGEVKDPIMELWKKGFMRVVHMGNVLIAHNEVVPPTEKQKSALIDLAIQVGDVSVEYDSGNDQKIIWSEHDVLEESENILRPPKSYRVTTSVVSREGGVKWYDCQVWKDGIVILSTSMTMFELKSKAYEIGVRRAWDIYNGKKEWY